MRNEPSPWVRAWAPHLPPGGLVLDLACGGGRHATYLHALGHPVLALDRKPPTKGDTLCLEFLPEGMEFLLFDLEMDLAATGRALKARAPFEGIVVVNYLHRPLLPLLPELLCEGGLLIYETFLSGQEKIGRPRNPDFLLRPGELLEGFKNSLQVLGFEEGLGLGGVPGLKQRFCGRRGS